MDQPDESVVHGSKAHLRQLPSIDRLLRLPGVSPLLAAHGRAWVTTQARELAQELRATALASGTSSPLSSSPLSSSALSSIPFSDEALAAALARRCESGLAPRLRPVLNLTGTVIHTNLGRAVLADAALARLMQTLGSPTNLEFDLDAGGRGERDSLVEPLICELTGAEAATVVNNNAAAVLLTVAALARGREVILSRGELVEIGGAFRMPDVMASAGADLVEVGTTNRTHPGDYERAIGERTALLMKVHASNYAIEGFTAAVDERELASIAHARGLPLASDLGSGSLIDLSAYGLPREPMPRDKLAVGCDVVTFSGDKLLGGPQAGLIVGTRTWIERIRKSPLKRALRISKLPLAALEATLQLYLCPDLLPRDLPTLRDLVRPQAQIEALARALLPAMSAALAPRFAVELVALSSQVGSGSLPVDRLPSAGLAIAPTGIIGNGLGSALDELARALRELPCPVIGRIAQDRLLLDLRCLASAEPLQSQLPQLSTALGTRPHIRTRR